VKPLLDEAIDEMVLSNLTLFDKYDTGTHSYIAAIADVVSQALLRAYQKLIFIFLQSPYPVFFLECLRQTTS
jgi:hypothetical protein